MNRLQIALRPELWKIYFLELHRTADIHVLGVGSDYSLVFFGNIAIVCHLSAEEIFIYILMNILEQ